jgi:hypothetical protein
VEDGKKGEEREDKSGAVINAVAWKEDRRLELLPNNDTSLSRSLCSHHTYRKLGKQNSGGGLQRLSFP